VGKRAASLLLPPQRTAQATFTADGSGTTKVSAYRYRSCQPAQALRKRHIVGPSHYRDEGAELQQGSLFQASLHSDLKYWPATATPRGSLHPFGAGQSSNPYASHYSLPFAFSAFSCPLHQQLPLRVTCHLAMSREVGGESGLPRSRSCRPECPGSVQLAPVYSPAVL